MSDACKTRLSGSRVSRRRQDRRPEVLPGDLFLGDLEGAVHDHGRDFEKFVRVPSLPPFQGLDVDPFNRKDPVVGAFQVRDQRISQLAVRAPVHVVVFEGDCCGRGYRNAQRACGEFSRSG